MVVGLLAHNAANWLASHLNAYLQDDDEYRAITRETIIRGLAGVITYTPAEVSVRLDRPGPPRVASALELLLDEINATPPALPGATRPVTYHLAAPRQTHLPARLTCRSSEPCHVGRWVISPTISSPGAPAVKSRSTRSGMSCSWPSPSVGLNRHGRG